MRAVLVGAPGSGKGTQAERLAASLGIPSISTGEMLRDAVARGTPLGNRVRHVMASGGLVDDGLMAEVVSERLSRADARRGFLLDGYPRTLAQAATLDRLLENLAEPLDAVLYLEVPEPVLIRRAIERRRADDREDVVRERLRIYHEQTEPLVAHYRERDLLCRVDGDRPVVEVTADLVARLEASSWS